MGRIQRQLVRHQTKHNPSSDAIRQNVHHRLLGKSTKAAQQPRVQTLRGLHQVSVRNRRSLLDEAQELESEQVQELNGQSVHLEHRRERVSGRSRGERGHRTRLSRLFRSDHRKRGHGPLFQ